MLQQNFAQRKPRAGKGLLPPNPKQWGNEHNALDLRDTLNLAIDARLCPEAAFELLPDVIVVPHGEIPMAQIHIDHFRKQGLRNWSGVGIPLPDGSTLVVFNDAHPPKRIRSTLMEEFFHLRLKHPPSVVRVYNDKGAFRNYDGAIEGEAYGSGAAALLPYAYLKRMVEEGRSAGVIANAMDVSTDLVFFRAKVTKLYQRLRRN